jgi:RNA polymerase sigma-70 factor (ECF subfamily)
MIEREIAERTTVSDWLPALRAAEPEAIEWCYREYANALLALAFRITRNREDAEDVVHDVFVGLPEALRLYEERGQFSSWLKRVTARTALMHQRRANHRRETPRDVDIFPTQYAADRDAEGTSILDAVASAMRSLTPALRRVFEMKMIEGRTHAEIAHTLGISAGTSEVRLNRAVAKLRAMLGGRAA